MKYTIDGINVESNSEIGDKLANNMINFSIRNKSLKNKWISILRKDGFKCAHPNDGWVDREKKEIHLAYPYFNDNLSVGDMLMIAHHPIGKHHGEIRPVKIIAKRETSFGGGMIYYKFEDIKIKKSNEMMEYLNDICVTNQKGVELK